MFQFILPFFVNGRIGVSYGRVHSCMLFHCSLWLVKHGIGHLNVQILIVEIIFCQVFIAFFTNHFFHTQYSFSVLHAV